MIVTCSRLLKQLPVTVTGSPTVTELGLTLTLGGSHRGGPAAGCSPGPDPVGVASAAGAIAVAAASSTTAPRREGLARRRKVTEHSSKTDGLSHTLRGGLVDVRSWCHIESELFVNTPIGADP